MNSYDTAPKGHTYSNTQVRIETDAGVEGVGVMGYSPAGRQFAAEVRALLGANPLELYQTEDGRLIGRAPGFQGAAFQAHMIELKPPGLLPPHSVTSTPSHAGR